MIAEKMQKDVVVLVRAGEWRRLQEGAHSLKWNTIVLFRLIIGVGFVQGRRVSFGIFILE